jgi:class 3 adenylate cyclase
VIATVSDGPLSPRPGPSLRPLRAELYRYANYDFDPLVRDRRRAPTHEKAELPSGTVTFLFTDMEGSKRLLARLGGGYAEVLGEHRRVLRAAFDAYDGSRGSHQG